jgi:uncharacterized membrane protein
MTLWKHRNNLTLINNSTNSKNAQRYSTGLRAWWLEVRVLAGAGIFSLHHWVRPCSGVHTASYPMGTSGSFPGVRRPGCEADHSPPSSSRAKSAWSYTSSPQYAFMAWCSVKKSTVTAFSFPGGKGVKRQGRETNHSPPSSSRAKNTCSYTSTPQYAFMAWCLVKAQGQLYLYRDIFTTFIIVRYLIINVEECYVLSYVIMLQHLYSIRLWWPC